MAPRLVMRRESKDEGAVRRNTDDQVAAPAATWSAPADTTPAASGSPAAGNAVAAPPGAAAGDGSGPGAGGALPGLTIDSIVDALEERVLAEIDRRGGRYQGIF